MNKGFVVDFILRCLYKNFVFDVELFQRQMNFVSMDKRSVSTKKCFQENQALIL
jgi:hypothetical protein